MHCVHPARRQQARFEFDPGLIYLWLEINHLQANPFDTVIQDQILWPVIAMPGLLQVLPV